MDLRSIVFEGIFQGFPIHGDIPHGAGVLRGQIAGVYVVHRTSLLAKQSIKKRECVLRNSLLRK
jgi:hypothetical protein